jgi:type IV pilus assembly protein PilF
MKNGIGLFIVVIALLLSACVSDPKMDIEDRNDASDYNAQLGLAYINQGRYDLAMNKLKKAVEQNPDNAVAQHCIDAWVSSMRRKRTFNKHWI